MAPSRSAQFDLVVLGGGPAGLAAAWEAAIAGRSVCVIEEQPALGGLCATVERDGFRFDLGGHRIISKRAALVERLRALMGDELEERERKSVILLDGVRYRYPLVARELVEKLPAALVARAAVDYGLERARDAIRDDRDERTFRQWVQRRFGRTLYDLFFGPYTEKLWGLSADELSSDWASQRISLLNLADVSLRLAGLRRGGARTYARRYLYPRGGIGALFTRLARELERLGVVFHTSARAVALVRDRDNARVTKVRVTDLRATDGDDVTSELRCGAVISSVPLGALAALVAPEDPTLAAHAAALGHRAMRFVNVLLEGPGPVLGATWVYAADARLSITRIQEPAERSASMTPPGRASIMLELPADPASAAWSEPDEALASRLLCELASVGIDLRPRVIRAFSTHARYAYPVYRLGYQRHRDALFSAVSTIDNLWTVGRQGLFRYVFMDTAMEMGFAASRAFAEGRRADSRALFAIDNNPTPHELASVLR
jgi:protoporphyrinogen oxidase